MWLFYLCFNTSCERNITSDEYYIKREKKHNEEKFVGLISVLSVSGIFLFLYMRKRMVLE